MAHRFSFTHRIEGVDFNQFGELLCKQAFHEELARRINGESLVIEHFRQQGSDVCFKRRFPMQANLPAPIQKLVKGALTLSRQDRWNTKVMVCKCDFKINAPIHMALEIRLQKAVDGFDMHHDFEVEVKIPLLGKALAATIEKDIRKQAAEELLTLQEFCKGRLAGVAV